MKHLLSFFFLLFSIQAVWSQEIYFNWIKQLERQTGLPFEETYLVGIDAAKNVYVAGNFHNTVDLDPGPGITNITNPFDNIFICKFNSAGLFTWGKHLGKNDRYTVCKSLSVDAAGNIYTTGYFNGKADFDPGPDTYYLNSTTNGSPDNNDIFLSKLDTDGNFVWAKQIGDNKVDIGASIEVDRFGNLYATGYFTGIVDLDPGFGAATGGGTDLVTTYVIKLNANGDFKFAKTFEGDHFSAGEFITTDANGNVYIAGYYTGAVDFDPGPAIKTLTTEAFAQKTFLAKLDSTGNYRWAIKDVTGLDIAAADDGSVYTYGSNLAKYDINGNGLWQKNIGGTPNASYPYDAMNIDHSGNIYLTGLFRNTQDFDPGSGVYNMTTIGGAFASDVFISKLGSDGDFIWAKTFGGTAEDYATSIATHDDGTIYTAGVFSGQVDFDTGPDMYNVTAVPRGNAFIHKMSPCKNLLPTNLSIVSCKRYILNNISYDSSGVYTQVLRASSGCDSIVQLTLQVIIASSNINIVTCNDYAWNNRLLTASGTYSDTLQTSDGCDSIARLQLTITRATTSISTSICRGQAYNGHLLAGIYTDTFKTINGCDSVVNTTLSIMDKPVLSLGVDAEICAGDSIVLQPGVFSSYRWQDGSTGAAYTVKNTGRYALTVTNNCGTAQDEMTVKEGVCRMLFPTAFSPNGDGKNDRFFLLNAKNLTDFHLLVYNRYGQQVFETTDYTQGWEGMYKGKPAASATYVWFSQYKELGVLKNVKGTVTLLR